MAGTADMKLEVVVIHVSDVELRRALLPDVGLAFRPDFATDAHFRVVQITPTGSPCSIIFGTHHAASERRVTGPGTTSVLCFVCLLQRSGTERLGSSRR